MAKTICLSSVLPAPAEDIFDRVQAYQTLQFVASPLLVFSGQPADLRWQEGSLYQLGLRAFGILPLGRHRLAVRRLDRASGILETEEGNWLVPLWQHTISLQPLSARETLYQDQVTIDAGWLTGAVALWAVHFYKHRQKRWLKLLAQPAKAVSR